jgi:hypothetical protein
MIHQVPTLPDIAYSQSPPFPIAGIYNMIQYETEEWQYALTFLEGKLVKIETGGYGR